MAGSRVEKFGTIYSRIRGLIKAGALNEADRPVWYDIYATFPPKVAPSVDRYVDDRKPIDIVYHEDVIRAKFYEVYGKSDPVNMSTDETSLSQRFITKYKEIHGPDWKTVSTEQIERTASELIPEGIKLRTLEEIKQAQEEQKKALLERRQKMELDAMKATQTLSQVLSFSEDDEDTDTMDESEPVVHKSSQKYKDL